MLHVACSHVRVRGGRIRWKQPADTWASSMKEQHLAGAMLTKCIMNNNKKKQNFGHFEDRRLLYYELEWHSLCLKSTFGPMQVNSVRKARLDWMYNVNERQHSYHCQSFDFGHLNMASYSPDCPLSHFFPWLRLRTGFHHNWKSRELRVSPGRFSWCCEKSRGREKWF